MPSDYQIMNPEALLRKKMPLTHILVYVLMSNHKNDCHIPLYVGITNDTHRRFTSHEKAHWHEAAFQRPVKVWIGGVVKRSDALNAEQDLILRLSTLGYQLLNRDIDDEVAAKFQRENPLDKLPVSELIEYLSRTRPKTTAMSEWMQRWHDESFDQQKNAATPDDLFITASGTDVREHADYVLLDGTATTDELVLAVAKQSVQIYRDSGLSAHTMASIALKIATHYDPDVGYSTVPVRELSWMCYLTENRLGPYVKQIASTGLWAYIPGAGSRPSRYFPLFVEGVAERYLALSALDASHELAA